MGGSRSEKAGKGGGGAHTLINAMHASGETGVNAIVRYRMVEFNNVCPTSQGLK